MSKKALLVGINYVGSRSALKGCHNDVDSLKNVITTQFGFPENVIKVLRDSNKPGEIMPTKANIIAAIQWLAEGAKAGDHLVFHFSGHGGQVVDKNGDEADGFDEALIPCDYTTAGLIVDDWWEANLFAKLPAGAKLTVVFDCCHSGSGMDLPYKAVSAAAAVPLGGNQLPFAEVAKARSVMPTKEEMENHKKQRRAEWEKKKIERRAMKEKHFAAWGLKNRGVPKKDDKKKDDSDSSDSSDDDKKRPAGGPKKEKKSNPFKKDKKEKKEKKEKPATETNDRFIGRIQNSAPVKWTPQNAVLAHAAPTAAATGATPPPVTTPAPTPAPVATAAVFVPEPPPSQPIADPMATIVLVSGCQDDQCSADATAGGVSFGALTNAFTKALLTKKGLTYIEVLFHTRDALKSQAGITQTPQLSFNRAEFDLTKPFEF